METCQHLVQIPGQLIAPENTLWGDSFRAGALCVGVGAAEGSSGCEKGLKSKSGTTGLPGHPWPHNSMLLSTCKAQHGLNGLSPAELFGTQMELRLQKPFLVLIVRKSSTVLLEREGCCTHGLC